MGDDKLPEFNEWVSMFVEGIKMFIVEVIYAIIPFVLFVAVFFSASSVSGTAGAAISFRNNYLDYRINIILFNEHNCIR